MKLGVPEDDLVRATSIIGVAPAALEFYLRRDKFPVRQVPAGDRIAQKLRLAAQRIRFAKRAAT